MNAGAFVLAAVVVLASAAVGVFSALALARALDTARQAVADIAAALRDARRDVQTYALKAENRRIVRRAVEGNRGHAARAATALVRDMDGAQASLPGILAAEAAANGAEAELTDYQRGMASLGVEPGWRTEPPGDE